MFGMNKFGMDKFGMNLGMDKFGKKKKFKFNRLLDRIQFINNHST
jgi:hypothetical protein